MQAYAVFAVNDHLEYLLADAARRRAAKASAPSLRTRLSAAVTAFRAGTPTPATGPRSMVARSR